MEPAPSQHADLMAAALADEDGRTSRVSCCSDLAAAMTKLGQILWAGGWMIALTGSAATAHSGSGATRPSARRPLRKSAASS
jgi:hypothetical protein